MRNIVVEIISTFKEIGKKEEDNGKQQCENDGKPRRHKWKTGNRWQKLNKEESRVRRIVFRKTRKKNLGAPSLKYVTQICNSIFDDFSKIGYFTSSLNKSILK